MLCVRFRGRSDKVKIVCVGGTLAGIEWPPPAEKPAGEEVRIYGRIARDLTIVGDGAALRPRRPGQDDVPRVRVDVPREGRLGRRQRVLDELVGQAPEGTVLVRQLALRSAL